MVERAIGRRTGTGGSDGVAYLDRTAMEYRVFHEIWAVRSLLLKGDIVPALAHADDYRLRVEDDPDGITPPNRVVPAERTANRQTQSAAGAEREDGSSGRNG